MLIIETPRQYDKLEFGFFYCITSLPVYPNTVHGQCTSVVLDTTSNKVYCILLLMDARYSVVQAVPRGGDFSMIGFVTSHGGIG